MEKLNRLVKKYNERVEVDEKKWGKATLIRALIARGNTRRCAMVRIELSEEDINALRSVVFKRMD